MQKIDLETSVLFGKPDETPIDITAINVVPISFVEYLGVWEKPYSNPKKADASLQKNRILHQAHFMVGSERYIPSLEELGRVDFRTIRKIMNALQTGHGTAGKVIGDGDGLVKPILYQLGDPIVMTSKGVDASIREIEFLGSTYAQMEDVLAADNSLAQAVALIRTVATPVGGKTKILTHGMIDQIGMADGVTIMSEILPRF